MFSKCQIHHFKSIEEADFELSRVNIFVGNNGSGKSNVIDALRFIKEAFQNGLDRAISDRHGMESIRQWSPTRPYRTHIALEYAGDNSSGAYLLAIESSKGLFRVFREEIDRSEATFYEFEPDGNFVSSYNRVKATRDKDGSIEIRDWTVEIVGSEYAVMSFEDALARSDVNFTIDKQRTDQFDELLIHTRAIWNLSLLRRQLTSFQAYSIFPNTLRLPQEPSNETFLSPEGRNLASVFKRMRKTKRGNEAIAQITDAMRFILPNLERITVLNVGGYLVPSFQMLEPTGKRHAFNVSQMSDGTLRVLGLLTALYQEPRPDVIALEEPERTVNPGVLAVLAESIKEISKRSQILITTHSPNMLDYFDPSEIRTVELIGGKTRVSPISPVQVDAVKERLFSLGELLASEGLHS